MASNSAHIPLNIIPNWNDEGLIPAVTQDADTGEVLEFCDPRIQQIKATLEELFDIEVLHHNLNIYARKRTR